MTLASIRIPVCLLALLTLSACACPRTAPYDGTPYHQTSTETERTAGQGPAVENDGGYCVSRALDLR